MDENARQAGDPTRHAIDFIAGHADQVILLGDPILDRLVSTVLEIGAELWTQRRRSMALERALAVHGIAVASAIEQAVPSDAERAEDAAARDALIDRLYGPLLAALSTARQKR